MNYFTNVPFLFNSVYSVRIRVEKRGGKNFK